MNNKERAGEADVVSNSMTVRWSQLDHTKKEGGVHSHSLADQS